MNEKEAVHGPFKTKISEINSTANFYQNLFSAFQIRIR